MRDAARILGLTDLLDRKPKALSGGQRQRVAMGRAIVREPRAFLMDEPLSNLDAKLRVQMRAEIARIQADLGTTTVYVTHDQTEAMTMGDRVAVLRDGLLQQVDEPQALYDRPKNLFVAGFIGSPAMNLVEAIARARRRDRRRGLRSASPGARARARRRDAGARRRGSAARSSSESVPRTSRTRRSRARRAGRRMPVTVDLVEALGSELLVHFDAGAPVVITDDEREMAEGLEEVATAFVGRLDPRSRARQGDTVELAVDTARVHVFDPETGDAIR